MTNSTIDIIQSHRSIRAYKPDLVPDETVELIVSAGQRASTSSNMQFTTVIAVKDAQKRAQLAELCGDQDHIRQAPVFLAWCADRRRLDHACTMRGFTQNTEYLETFLVAAIDVGIFMQTTTIAAESLGLGMCYIGAIRNNPRQIIELLELPHHLFPISGMTLGWPDAEPLLRPRLDLKAVLHWEQYDESHLQEELDHYDKAMAATGIYGGRQVKTADGQVDIENYGWLEHSARRVSTPNRQELRQIVEEQGWALQ
ncbi:MAG TPA: NADPH-dependent oxidoreductase [Caldilineaceae bacterium]|nr:NADPH-dependent oxidoreductase [Caldilineaceae bacterium]